MILDQPESINIITDSAFGACQVIVQHFPKSWRIFQHYNADCSDEINRFSGVADLEGTRWLSEQHLKTAFGKITKHYINYFRIYKKIRKFFIYHGYLMVTEIVALF